MGPQCRFVIYFITYTIKLQHTDDSQVITSVVYYNSVPVFIHRLLQEGSYQIPLVQQDDSVLEMGDADDITMTEASGVEDELLHSAESEERTPRKAAASPFAPGTDTTPLQSDGSGADRTPQQQQPTEGQVGGGAAAAEKPPAMYRHCDSQCATPPLWATRLHHALATFHRDQSFCKLQNAIMEFESCDQCRPTEYPHCDLGDDCTDLLKMLRRTQPHFQLLRTVVRRFYELRQCNNWIIECDLALSSGSWPALEKFFTEDSLPSAVREEVSHKFACMLDCFCIVYLHT